MPVSVTCNVCGSTFSVSPYRSDEAKYCSNSCQYKSMEVEFIEKVCEVCQEEFEVKPSRSDSARFCSTDCYNELRPSVISDSIDTEKIAVECELCEDKFDIFPSREDRARFCSPECRHKLLSEKLSKESTKVRNSSEYRKWRKNVKERDGCCVRCNSEESLHAHHIIPVSENKDLATDVSNGETLCKSCHAKEHPDVAVLVDPNN